ncbi:MAG TPA: phosphate ABC transporter substrate-binding protein PstS [Euryarchaeota archaeon]|nr:phosphate ABC transporter substrate-binding protein PstS [Euryarchaeota archaeon]
MSEKNGNEIGAESVRDRISDARKKSSSKRLVIAVISIIAVAVIIGSVWGLGLGGSNEVTLSGAGASFPFPLISKWIQMYENETGVKVSYESIGSSGGINRIKDGLVDFGASDAPLKPVDDDLGLVHIPETIGAVAAVYNLVGIDTGLLLTGDILTGIFMGNITAWDDPRITEINSELTLPSEEIVVAHRSDGSGTTFVFTSYLAEINQTWSDIYGASKTITWPEEANFRGGSGNAGVAAIVQTTPYSIGYIELAYALENDIDFAALENQEGFFVLPSIESTAEAASNAAPSLPAGDASWDGVEIVNAPGEGAYPIATFTYILIYKEQEDLDKGKALIEFLMWIIHDGQDYSESLYYVPLPESVVALNEVTLNGITHNGEPML